MFIVCVSLFIRIDFLSAPFLAFFENEAQIFYQWKHQKRYNNILLHILNVISSFLRRNKSISAWLIEGDWAGKSLRYRGHWFGQNFYPLIALISFTQRQLITSSCAVCFLTIVDKIILKLLRMMDFEIKNDYPISP